MPAAAVRWPSVIALLIAIFAAGLLLGRASRGAEPSAADTAVRLAQEMAASAARRDVKTLEQLIPQTDRVVYVSNGHPITGRLYGETLGKYYASLEALEFHWDKWEVTPIADKAAVFTGWASVRTVDRQGHDERARAIFTMVFADDGTGWKRVIAQKWQDGVPAVREVHAAAASPIPASSGLAVRFTEPVNAGGAAFKLECPAGKPVALNVSPAPGDGESYLLQPKAKLPAGAACKLAVLASQVADTHFGQQMAGDFRYLFAVAPAPPRPR
jgi:SnoaL-like domain